MATATKDSRKTAFVISPIGSSGTPEHRRYLLALDYIVKKALPPETWEVIRADDEESPDSIGAKVIERIIKSDLIVANLTDLNPNVFYELAVAHGFRKPVVHMIEKGQQIPFDVSDQRAIFYDLTDPASVHDATTRLANSTNYLEGADGEARNPLSQFAAFEAISSATSPAEAGTAVADALQVLTHQVARLSRRINEVEFGTRSPATTERQLSSLDAWTEAERAREFMIHEEAVGSRRLAEIEGQIARLEAIDAEIDAQQSARLTELRHEAARHRASMLQARKERISRPARMSARDAEQGTKRRP